MGLTLPPPPGTRLRAGTDGEYQDGDLTLSPGIGVQLRDLDPGPGIVVDGSPVDARAPAGLFIPDVAAWPGATLTMPQGRSILRFLQASIAGTTPGASDASNRWAIRLAGGTSGSIDLPIIGDTREHELDRVTPATVGEQEANGGNSTAYEFAVSFSLSAAVTITGLSWHTGSQIYGEEANVRMGIADAGLTEYLAISPWMLNPAPSYEWVYVPLATSFDAEQDTAYWVGFESDGEYASVLRSTFGDTAGSVSVPGPGQSASTATRDRQFGDTPHRSFLDLTEDDASSAFWAFRIHGVSEGVEVVGDVTVSTVETGTAPADPTSVNLRMQWDAAE